MQCTAAVLAASITCTLPSYHHKLQGSPHRRFGLSDSVVCVISSTTSFRMAPAAHRGRHKDEFTTSSECKVTQPRPAELSMPWTRPARLAGTALPLKAAACVLCSCKRNSHTRQPEIASHQSCAGSGAEALSVYLSAYQVQALPVLTGQVGPGSATSTTRVLVSTISAPTTPISCSPTYLVSTTNCTQRQTQDSSRLSVQNTLCSIHLRPQLTPIQPK